MTSTLLSVLVVDPSAESVNRLVRELRAVPVVTRISTADTVASLGSLDRTTDVNTVFVDPLAFDLNEVSREIFSVRNRAPGIVFVLHMDINEAERRRGEVFSGERRRFLHYYRLNKNTQPSELGANLEVALDLCRYDLDWQMSRDSIELLRTKLHETGDRMSQEVLEPMLREIGAKLHQLRGRGTLAWSKAHDRSVFLSYSFSEPEFATGLKELLEQRGFAVVTGDNTNTYISEAIQHRIEGASFFVSLMTRQHMLSDGTGLPSLWLIEEKALAIAANKPMVLMVEDGVSQIGGLQSDYQRLRFSGKDFMTAALRAVRQLESYLGGG